MALLSNQQLETLRNNYARIERIDPASPNYRALISKLSSYPQEVLQQLAGANIKFISALARNRIKVKKEDVSPSRVHADIIEQMKSEIQQVSTISDEQSYKRAVRQLLIRKPVIPASQVEQFTRRFIQAYPFSQYRIAKKTGDMRTSNGVQENFPKQQDLSGISTEKLKEFIKKHGAGGVPTHGYGAQVARVRAELQRREREGVKEGRKLLQTQAAGAKTAKVYRDTDTDEYVVKFFVDGKHQPQADYFTDDKQDAMNTARAEVNRSRMESVKEADDFDTDEIKQIEKEIGSDDDENPRDIEKEVPSELDLEWISKFDLGEIKEAIQKIIDHLSETEDEEQIDLLRNDIRILDNLHNALGKKDSAGVDKYWKIAKEEGSHEHLHPEFAKRMDDATSLVHVKEGYIAETVTYNSKAKWDKAAKKFRVKTTGKSETAFCKDTGEMMGRWSGEKGWLESC